MENVFFPQYFFINVIYTEKKSHFIFGMAQRIHYVVGTQKKRVNFVPTLIMNDISSFDLNADKHSVLIIPYVLGHVSTLQSIDTIVPHFLCVSLIILISKNLILR